jgi:nucleoid-associated protein YgaU
MFLGLVIVFVVVGLVFNYFQRRRGSISLPGVSDQKQLLEPVSPTKISESNIYVVKKGDSLWKIAERELGSGYKWVELAKTNNLKNVGVLIVGQKLTLTEKTNSQAFDNSTYKVVKGDSLWKIAVTKYGDGFQWTKIWNLNKNKLNNPGKLEIGMTLTLPNLN